ncbi:MAG: FtsX-like permease family protein [Polyangiaceae bacterium]|nr:FtsX-like permease family protein [Polyangiaceae bacterium]
MLISALDRKLLRDLSHLRGQVITIALVVACGIASYVTMKSAFQSLVYSQSTYYERYRFADVFASLEQAPAAVAERLTAIDGVREVDTRVVQRVMVPVEGLTRPAVGTVVSLPRHGSRGLNAVHLTRGRLPDPTRSDEALVLDAFAEAHGLSPGDRVAVVMNGALRQLRITGFGMSPEYVFTMPPGAMSHDPKLIAVLWMGRDAVAAAHQMEGAFNDVALTLEPGASQADVLGALDRVLAPYGAFGAVPRAKQPSHYMLSSELSQLESMAGFVPVLFLFVAAFLLNVVLSRLVYLQRSQIATLKAVGYADRDVGLHYLKLVSLVVLLGAVVGVAAGAWLGRAMTELYTGQYFRFPTADYRLTADVVVISVSISLAAAVVGALAAVRQVVSLPPAEAMRPPSPVVYRRSVLELLGLSRLLGPSARMVVRELERRPLRLALSSIGISLSVGIVVIAGYWSDAIDYMLDVQFHRSMREDVTVTFVKPLSARAARELQSMPGVWRAEGISAVAVRYRAGHRQRDSALMGYPRDLELRHLLDSTGERVTLPPTGVVLTRKLAEVLEVRVGDSVEIELREGSRRTTSATISGLVDEPFGMQGHVDEETFARLIGQSPTINTALLRVDRAERAQIFERLKRLPWVAAVSYPGEFREQFEGQSGSIMRVYTLILTLFASIIAIGVVYNNARIALSQRSRDLASLRVLGFTRGEIAAILFGELSAQVVLALPLGLWVGHLLVQALGATVDPETYRLPVFVSLRTFAFAIAVTVVSAVISFFLVRRKLDQLDLIGVLKTRE